MIVGNNKINQHFAVIWLRPRWAAMKAYHSVLQHAAELESDCGAASRRISSTVAINIKYGM